MIHVVACRDDDTVNEVDADGTVVVVVGNSQDGTSEEHDYI